MKRLSDEAISKILDRFDTLKRRNKTHVLHKDRAVARKAEQEAWRQVIEWGEEDCPHVYRKRGKKWCGDCWQELKKLVEEK